MSDDLPGSSDRYPLAPGFEHPRVVFWFLHCYNAVSAPQCCQCRLSSTASHAPATIVGAPGLLPVFRVFSSTLLPGFSGPESSVLPVDLPPSDPSPLRDLLIGLGFMASLAAVEARSGGLPWVRRTTSPYAVQLHWGSVHRISGLALPRLLDLLPSAI